MLNCWDGCCGYRKPLSDESCDDDSLWIIALIITPVLYLLGLIMKCGWMLNYGGGYSEYWVAFSDGDLYSESLRFISLFSTPVLYCLILTLLWGDYMLNHCDGWSEYLKTLSEESWDNDSLWIITIMLVLYWLVLKMKYGWTLNYGWGYSEYWGTFPDWDLYNESLQLMTLFFTSVLYCLILKLMMGDYMLNCWDGLLLWIS